MGAYLIFMTLNIPGVSVAANFELCVTLLAVIELCVFMAVVALGFAWSNFAANGWAHGNELTLGTWSGIFAAIPFAIWSFWLSKG